jgi:hypothetical protein
MAKKSIIGATGNPKDKMANNYRIKYKTGDFEIEVESSDKSFVESKLKELIGEDRVANVKPGKSVAKKITPIKRVESGQDNSNEDGIDINEIVNSINDSDKHSAIEQKILKKSNRLNRILLILYFTNKIYGSVAITTGEIEKITDQLGIKISSANVASAIKVDLKYFAADSVRKKGAIVRYKINKKGIDEFEKIIAA